MPGRKASNFLRTRLRPRDVSTQRNSTDGTSLPRVQPAPLFKGFPDANVAGTSEHLDGAVAWLAEHRDQPFCLWFHSWATHMPYDILHSERQDWLAAKEEIIEGIQSDFNARQDRQWRFALELANIGSMGNFNGADAAEGRRGSVGGYR